MQKYDFFCIPRMMERFFCRTDYTDGTDLFMIAVYSQCEDNYGPENGERIHGRLPPSAHQLSFQSIRSLLCGFVNPHYKLYTALGERHCL